MSTERGSGPEGGDDDPDADPEMMQSASGAQADQAEGADDDAETSD